jgi:hypothetical protein
VADANRRCNQENNISQLKSCDVLAAPLDSLVGNWACMAIASLAWTPKIWSGISRKAVPCARQTNRIQRQT